MARFLGHFYGSTAVSAVAALPVGMLELVPPDRVPILFALGVAGGLLPDIDSDNSVLVRVLFTLLAVTAAFFACYALLDRFPVFDLALLWVGVFLLVRFGLLKLFTRSTAHRGLAHSLLGMAFTGLAGTNTAYYAVGWTGLESWAVGGFVALGYLTHLALDEVFSLDTRAGRLKRSFGSALKLFSAACPRMSATLFAAAVVLALSAPPLRPVVDTVRERLAQGLGKHQSYVSAARVQQEPARPLRRA